MTTPLDRTGSNSGYQYDSARLQAPLRRELAEVWNYRDLVRQLTSRNIKVRYQHSLLGVGWTVLTPLLTTAVLSIVFMTVFRQAAPDYPAYLLSGLLMWNFFVQTTSSIGLEVSQGTEVWRRIYTPKSVFALATLATGFVHLCLALIPLAVLMLVLHVPIGWATLTALLPLVCVALFSLGVGFILASCATRFRDIIDLYQVASGAWLYLTPVIYPRSIVPDRFQWLLTLNPMTWFVESFRTSMLQNTVPSVSSMFGTAAIALVTVIFGYWLFIRATNDLATRS